MYQYNTHITNDKTQDGFVYKSKSSFNTCNLMIGIQILIKHRRYPVKFYTFKREMKLKFGAGIVFTLLVSLKLNVLCKCV